MRLIVLSDCYLQLTYSVEAAALPVPVNMTPTVSVILLAMAAVRLCICKVLRVALRRAHRAARGEEVMRLLPHKLPGLQSRALGGVGEFRHCPLGRGPSVRDREASCAIHNIAVSGRRALGCVLGSDAPGLPSYRA